MRFRRSLAARNGKDAGDDTGHLPEKRDLLCEGRTRGTPFSATESESKDGLSLSGIR